MARRLLGSLLLVYGALGIVLVIVGAVVGFDTAGRTERLTLAADDTLAAAARATSETAASFADADESLAGAESSADEAAALARQASGTLSSLGTAMRVSILGTQPLLPLADDFDTSADQAQTLAGTLDTMRGSLSDTRTDVADINVELEHLADELDRLRDEIGGDGAPPPLRLVVALLLAWVAVQSVAALGAGTVLLGVQSALRRMRRSRSSDPT